MPGRRFLKKEIKKIDTNKIRLVRFVGFLYFTSFISFRPSQEIDNQKVTPYSMSLLEWSMSLLERSKERFGRKKERFGKRYEGFRRGMRDLEKVSGISLQNTLLWGIWRAITGNGMVLWGELEGVFQSSHFPGWISNSVAAWLVDAAAWLCSGHRPLDRWVALYEWFGGERGWKSRK